MARRRRNNDTGWLGVAVVGGAVWLLVWLYQSLPGLVALVSVAGLGFWAFRRWHNRQIIQQAQVKEGRTLNTAERAAAVTLGRHRYNPHAPYGSLVDIAAAVADSNWNVARRWLQIISYDMVGPKYSQADKDHFKKLMTVFASGDPAYRALLEKVLPVITQQPGIKQAEFTRGLPPQEVEIVRYMFYFAHELADLVRVKAGNSYRLYLPGQVPLEIAATTAAKRRPRRATKPKVP